MAVEQLHHLGLKGAQQTSARSNKEEANSRFTSGGSIDDPNPGSRETYPPQKSLGIWSLGKIAIVPFFEVLGSVGYPGWELV